MSNMTYEQLVEKVSKAICMVNCHNPDAVLTDNLDHSKWEIYVPDARAAIATIAEATKEPTEAMIMAGRVTVCSHGWGNGGDVIENPQDVFSDMHAAKTEALADHATRWDGAQLSALELAARRAALEEAAKECDRLAGGWRDYAAERRRAAGQCADACRALMDKEPGK